MSTSKLYGRYELKEVIGEGGQGIVYRAVDQEMQSEVALKTIKELLDPQQIELFRRECAVLRKLRHPNVVDLYDFGVGEDNGQQKPFFVMPFLPGLTLDKLIRNHAAQLTPDRVVDIVTQTARGLQAAHDIGLVHRDVKPSNIFVLGDDSVKIIDFGVVHVTDQRSRTGFKGTLPYMSPEQLGLTPPTAVSDVFSLAVVCYEALTRRRPFTGNSEGEIQEAILRSMPPPVSELNPAVSLALSQVVHAAMAKQPWNRTSSARQFAEELQRAVHNQPIERFDAGRIEPRIVRAQRALEASQYDFAAEILSELEAEGHIHVAIRSLRRQIDQALRAKSIKQSLEAAQHRFSEGEYQLALQKVNEVLRLDPSNADGLALKSEIENQYRTQQIENWFQLAQDHIQNYAFTPARQALQNVLRLKPTNTMAIQMLSDVDRRENEYLREHREKEELYKEALDSWHRGEVSVALSKLERVLELDRRAPDNASSESAVSYQNLYNQVRSEHDGVKNAYEEARKLLGENEFVRASAICDEFLAKFPEHALFMALKFDIGESERQYVSAYIVKVDREVEAEPDLDRKVAILSEAQQRYPEEAHFRERLDKVTRRRDLVATIAQKVRNLEERGQYAEALGQAEILRSIHPQYPGLELEIDRITKRRDQQAKTESKARWIDQIDSASNKGDFSHALTLLKSALADFPGDPQLIAQERLAHDGQDRCREAVRMFENAQKLCAQDLKAGVDGLWRAHRLDGQNALIRAVLVEMLLKRSSEELETDSTLSEQLIRQAVDLDPGNAQAKGLQQMILDRRKDRAIDVILTQSREAQAAGDVNAAMAAIEKGLAAYGDEPRLLARKDVLLKLSGTDTRPEEKERDLSEMWEISRQIRSVQDPAARDSLLERSRVIARKHPGDGDVETIFRATEDFWGTVSGPKRTTPPQPVQPETDRESETKQEPREERPTPIRPPFSEVLKAKLGLIVDALRQGIQGVGDVIARIPKKGLGVGAGIVSVVAIVVVLFLFRKPPTTKEPTPPPPPVLIALNASVPGAHLLLNGKDQGVGPLNPTLEAGSYELDAFLAGFASKGPVSFKVGPEMTDRSFNVVLEPLASVFRIGRTEFEVEGELDGMPLKLDADGSYDGIEVANRPHVLRLSSRFAGNIRVEFEAETGIPPKVTKIESGQTLVIALATLHDHGQLYATSNSWKVGVNGPPDRVAGEQGLPLTGLLAHNQIARDDGKNYSTEPLDVNNQPTLSLFIGSPSGGSLEIVANVEASVSIQPTEKNGIATVKRLTGGTLVVSNLAPQQYHVSIEADGYQADARNVRITKGKPEKVIFTLNKKPEDRKPASFELKGGTPDAELWLDERLEAKLNANGDYTSNPLPPGSHRIQLKKSDFEPGPVITKDFPSGIRAPLSGKEFQLVPFGWLEFNVTPASSEIRYNLVGEDSIGLAKSGDKPRVKQGQYSIKVKAVGNAASLYSDFDGNAYNVEAGKPLPVKIDLPRKDQPPPPPPPRLTVQGLEERADGTSQCRRSTCLVSEKRPATYAFSIKLEKGKKAEWVANYVDDKNYIEYQLEEKNFTVTVYDNGKKRESKSGNSFSRNGDFYQILFTVTSSEITISSGNGRPIPSPAGVANPLAGSFGFRQNVIVKSDYQFK